VTISPTFSKRERGLTGFQALSRRDACLAAAVGLLGLALYVRTLAPGLLPGDSGEFQALAYLLGHTHPTGYPVYLALAKLFTLLPVASVAWRVNLFSAVMAALTVSGVYVAGRRLTDRRGAAVVGALALAVSPTFWSQAIIAEVYAPGAAFFVWIVAILLWWDADPRPRALFVAGLLGGLSLGMHMSVILLVPAVGVFLALQYRRQSLPQLRGLKTAVGGALVGVAVLIVIFLLIHWRRSPAGYFPSVIEPSRSAWGLSAEQIDGPGEQLLFGWSARQFRSFMFADPDTVMPKLASRYGENLPSELAWSLILLAGVGALNALRSRPRVAILLLLALVAQWLYTFNYDIWDLYVFFIPSYVLLAVLTAAGLGALVDAVNRFTARWGSDPVWADATLSVLVIVIAVYPTLQPRLDAVRQGTLAFTWDDFEEYPVGPGGFEEIHQQLQISLAQAPQNGIMFLDWDLLYPCYYVAHVELGRTDLAFVETYPADDQDGLANSALAFIAAQQAERPVLVSERLPELASAGYRLTPLRVGALRLYRVTEGSQ